MINKIKYVSLKTVCGFMSVKFYIKMLKHCHLTMWGALVTI